MNARVGPNSLLAEKRTVLYGWMARQVKQGVSLLYKNDAANHSTPPPPLSIFSSPSTTTTTHSHHRHRSILLGHALFFFLHHASIHDSQAKVTTSTNLSMPKEAKVKAVDVVKPKKAKKDKDAPKRPLRLVKKT